MAKIQITAPTPEAAAEMGIRDWPQQAKSGTWDEFVAEDKTVVRYVLDGAGFVKIIDQDIAATTTKALGPGTLVEVTGTASLSWSSDDGEIVILTPGFEQGGTLIGVVIGTLGIFGALIAGAGQ